MFLCLIYSPLHFPLPLLPSVTYITPLPFSILLLLPLPPSLQSSAQPLPPLPFLLSSSVSFLLVLHLLPRPSFVLSSPHLFFPPLPPRSSPTSPSFPSVPSSSPFSFLSSSFILLSNSLLSSSSLFLFFTSLYSHPFPPSPPLLYPSFPLLPINSTLRLAYPSPSPPPHRSSLTRFPTSPSPSLLLPPSVRR